MLGASGSRAVAVCAAVTAGAALVALGCWALFGAGPLNYDGQYALLWGSQLADGQHPEVALPLAPTPKPLLIALAGALDRVGVGHRAEGVLLAVSVGSLGWLTAAVGAVAARLAGGWAAVLAAAILLTREPVLSWALRGYAEVLFCALLLTVLVLELRRPRAGVGALLLLSVAGLLRPEAWLLIAAYLVWCWPAMRPSRRAVGLVLACAAPLLWASFDLLASGVPWWSLTGTRDTAATLARPTGPDALVLIAPRRVGEILREPVLVAALLGAALLLVRPLRGSTQVLAALAATALAFSLLALADLPVIARYLLSVAALLTIIAASAVVWLLGAGRPPALRLAGGALAVWIVLTAPGQLQRLRSTAGVLASQRAIAAELHRLADAGGLSSSCRPLSLPNHRSLPAIAWWTASSASALRADPRGPAASGTVLVPSPFARRLFVLDPRDPVKPWSGVPAGFAVSSTGRYWTVAQRCGGPG